MQPWRVDEIAPPFLISDLLQVITAGLEDAQAEDILSVPLLNHSALADYIVIATARSTRHLQATADQMLRLLKEKGAGTARVEGLEGGDWVLIDMGDIILHLFRAEIREFYNLEKMWSLPDNEILEPFIREVL